MTPLKADSTSIVEHIPFIYKRVDQEAIASLSNFTGPLEIITAELLERLLYKTLQKKKYWRYN